MKLIDGKILIMIVKLFHLNVLAKFDLFKFQISLNITNQPERQHRARYQTEGSRGAVKDRSQSGFPVVELRGYDNPDKPAILQVFINILLEPFSYNFSLVTVWLCNFLTQEYQCKSSICKMLIKLTTGFHRK
jgi:hypothetical protein